MAVGQLRDSGLVAAPFKPVLFNVQTMEEADTFVIVTDFHSQKCARAFGDFVSSIAQQSHVSLFVNPEDIQNAASETVTHIREMIWVNGAVRKNIKLYDWEKMSEKLPDILSKMADAEKRLVPFQEEERKMQEDLAALEEEQRKQLPGYPRLDPLAFLNLPEANRDFCQQNNLRILELTGRLLQFRENHPDFCELERLREEFMQMVSNSSDALKTCLKTIRIWRANGVSLGKTILSVEQKDWHKIPEVRNPSECDGNSLFSELQHHKAVLLHRAFSAKIF